MRFDAITGDYGMGFFGHAYATASYLVNHPTFGWLGFGGVVSQSDGTVRIAPKDSGRSRLFVAPAGLWMTLQAGKIESVEFSTATREVRLELAPADAHTKAARLSVQTTVNGARMYGPRGFALERGMYTIPLGRDSTVMVLSPR